jgi:hypothetical protein
MEGITVNKHLSGAAIKGAVASFFVASFLSSAVAALPPETGYGRNYHTIPSVVDTGIAARDFDDIGCGYISLSRVCDASAWYSPKRPVPYWRIWDNKLHQTAQQMVAIISIMEKGGSTVDATEMDAAAIQRMKAYARDKIRRDTDRMWQSIAGVGMILAGIIFILFGVEAASSHQTTRKFRVQDRKSI